MPGSLNLRAARLQGTGDNRRQLNPFFAELDLAAQTAIAELWKYWSDGVGELHPFCPDCAEREFGTTPTED